MMLAEGGTLQGGGSHLRQFGIPAARALSLPDPSDRFVLPGVLILARTALQEAKSGEGDYAPRNQTRVRALVGRCRRPENRRTAGKPARLPRQHWHCRDG